MYEYCKVRSCLFFKDPTHTALLRLAWNKQDPNYLATVAMDSCEVIILDVRVPCTPVARLSNHRACVNGIAWAPHRYVDYKIIENILHEIIFISL